ncbi:undecaprenyldiphospho-muramoylpentapeptide beta-N-acetylglucosaminyltransferase [Arthrobacter sp. JSM 101049]|uniref:undecaprenyldiphospho-muramoylpentapeptide beta-N-acetylglucosaminyltransferase n=1 Tax=Arthrobacter sp. JSM 101049 TaxID=929097 RepID=UPI0035626D32
MTPSPSVVMAGGGTAGHVSPMLAIADAVRAAEPRAGIRMVGTPTGMETRLVPAAGYELETIARVPLPRRPSPDLLKLPWRFAAAVRGARRILRRAEADVVVGVGGYVCTPVYLAARSLSIPVVVHEANAKAGIANKVGARFAAAVGTAFEDTGLPGAELVGMPMRARIAGLDRAAAREGARSALGLDPRIPTLVVTGGSSGAQSINRALIAGLRRLAAEPGGPGFQTLHVTGQGKAMRDDDGTALSLPGYHQVEYVDGMDQAYAAADLLVARAGAGTVCEVAAVGLPSILVPLPIGNGEQALNARGLAGAGGAVVVPDAEFTADYVVRELPQLLADTPRLDTMAAAAGSQGRRDAAARMAGIVLDTARAHTAGETPQMGH